MCGGKGSYGSRGGCMGREDPRVAIVEKYAAVGEDPLVVEKPIVSKEDAE